MAIFTFSTKDKRPDDEQVVRQVKEHCERLNLNFSGLVVNLLKEYKTNSMDKSTSEGN